MTELTPDQMDKVSGGADPAVECQCSPDGKHFWKTNKSEKTRSCWYCNRKEKLDYLEIF